MKVELVTDELKEYLGWKMGWLLIPNEHEMILAWCAIYKPIKSYLIRKAQIFGRVVKGYWAGFMSESRGLKWDRKSRYGVK